MSPMFSPRGLLRNSVKIVPWDKCALLLAALLLLFTWHRVACVVLQAGHAPTGPAHSSAEQVARAANAAKAHA
jgi:hypothetical protein